MVVRQLYKEIHQLWDCIIASANEKDMVGMYKLEQMTALAFLIAAWPYIGLRPLAQQTHFLEQFSKN